MDAEAKAADVPVAGKAISHSPGSFYSCADRSISSNYARSIVTQEILQLRPGDRIIEEQGHRVADEETRITSQAAVAYEIQFTSQASLCRRHAAQFSAEDLTVESISSARKAEDAPAATTRDEHRICARRWRQQHITSHL